MPKKYSYTNRVIIIYVYKQDGKKLALLYFYIRLWMALVFRAKVCLNSPFNSVLSFVLCSQSYPNPIPQG